jgi:hypothetical protein
MGLTWSNKQVSTIQYKQLVTGEIVSEHTDKTEVSKNKFSTKADMKRWADKKHWADHATHPQAAISLFLEEYTSSYSDSSISRLAEAVNNNNKNTKSVSSSHIGLQNRRMIKMEERAESRHTSSKSPPAKRARKTTVIEKERKTTSKVNDKSLTGDSDSISSPICVKQYRAHIMKAMNIDDVQYRYILIVQDVYSNYIYLRPIMEANVHSYIHTYIRI